MIVASFTEASARGLKRIRFEKGHDGGFDERWLQKLVSRYPNLLPIEQIEPALIPAVPLCMELPVASGSVDVLYATPDGYLIVAETKLFRNPEARRKVVGQIIDYAKDLSLLSYKQLEAAIAKAEAPDGSGGHPKARVYETVASGREGVSEEQFIEAVSRNLKRGRFLLLVVGDGIQEGTEYIAEFLQQHAGMHFTLALVVLAVFELPGEIGGYLVQPRVPARTENIVRGIVTIEDGGIAVKPPKGGDRPATITEEKFYEELAASFPTVVPRLKAFTARLEAIGVSIEFGKSTMLFHWRPDEQGTWNLGAVTTSGDVWTDQINIRADRVGHLDLSHAYLNRLASFVPNTHVKEFPKQTSWFLAKKGGAYVTIDQLLAHEDDWLAAIQEFIAAVTDALKDQ
jgi:hypothetical protein